MDAGSIERVETGMQRGAAALFATAVAYAAYMFFAESHGQPELGLLTAGAGAAAFLPCSFILSTSGAGQRRFRLPDFVLPDFRFSESSDELLLTDTVEADELLLTDVAASSDELVLTEADRVGAPSEPLVLDDILAELGPEARVVRLFDRQAMPVRAPTPGQLHSRIADHLGDGAPLTPSDMPSAGDASQALSDALAELRRSLR